MILSLPADQQVVVILLVSWLAGSNIIERHFSDIFLDSFKHLNIQIYVENNESPNFYVYRMTFSRSWDTYKYPRCLVSTSKFFFNRAEEYFSAVSHMLLTRHKGKKRISEKKRHSFSLIHKSQFLRGKNLAGRFFGGEIAGIN